MTNELMDLLKQQRVSILLAGVMTLSACGGGGDEPTTPVTPPNSSPTANAGVDQDVDEFATVTLDGSLSTDPDAGDVLTFAWAQTAGTPVTLSATDLAQPTFDAPDVTAANTPDTLTFELTVSDGTASHSNSVVISVINIGLGINTPPSADAGPDNTVAKNSPVSLDGSASDDPDGDTLNYAWVQTSGISVVLSDANIAEPSFTSPDVAPSATETLSFQLTVDDGSDSDIDTVDILVQEGLSQVNVSGIVSYEWVPTNENGVTCFGLDFSGTTVRAIRAATIQLLDASNTVLGTTVSGDDGAYLFSDIAADTEVRIRVRAELKRSGTPNWDVEVRDNVDTSASPPLLVDRPLYVTQWPLFNTGINHISDADFTATTGWGGSSYTGARAAAPFAILDDIYTGMKLILSADPTASFSALDAYWSVDNTETDGSPTNIDLGELGGSFYSGGTNDSLFLMGDADVNTGEFDPYVTLHEWGHYVEDNFSRSDSVGGRHFIGGFVDARVAFGEGWGTGFGAMAADDPMACNTGAADGTGSWGFNVETYNDDPFQGWYNELSVATLLLDLFDTNDDGADNASIGFAPIYEVMTNQQRTTEAFTTLFSFASLLRPALNSSEQTFLDALLAAENIETAGLDIWASTQANINIFPNNARDVLPLYIDYTANGSTLNVCTNKDHDDDGDGNKPAEYRYLRITTSTSAVYDVSIVPNPIPPATSDAPDPDDSSLPRDRSDPDMYILLNGDIVALGISGEPDSETFVTQQLPADVYVADVHEWRFQDPDASSDYPDQICFDLTMTAQ